jgi:hypothetical protein
MSKKGAVPDAWDDDWVKAADVRASLQPYGMYCDADLYDRSPTFSSHKIVELPS